MTPLDPRPDRLRPLADCPVATLASITGVLSDIDDTLTTEGRVGAEAYAALARLRAAGLLVVPITGRPAGWCDMIARTWPVDAVVGENGAFWFRYDRASRRMLRRFVDSPEVRAAKRARLASLAEAILREVPEAAVAADQRYRETDLAIDVCEDVPALGSAGVARILALFEQAGCTAKISSIHVNGWYGTYDKLTMTRQLFSEVFATDLDAARSRFAFVGDSPNDAPMFAHFPIAVGVANVRTFADRCAALPAWITPSAYGAGFAELAAAVLAVRT